MTDNLQEENKKQTRSPKDQLFDFIDNSGKDYKFTIQKLEDANSPYIKPARMCAIVKSLYLTPKTYDSEKNLQDCTPQSIINAMLKCSQWGLEPGNDLVYLNPYGGVCKAQLGYRGKIELCSRIGIRLIAQNVFENDDFAYGFGNRKFFKHNPKWPEKGLHKGSYSYATFEDGDFDFHVLTREEMQVNRNAAKTDKAWKTNELAMYRKTAINMHYNYLPSTLKDSSRLPIEDEGNGVIIDHDIVDKFNMSSDVVTVEAAPDTADVLMEELV